MKRKFRLLRKHKIIAFYLDRRFTAVKGDFFVVTTLQKMKKYKNDHKFMLKVNNDFAVGGLYLCKK